MADKPLSQVPHFKFVRIRLSILLVPASEVCLAVDREDSIVHGKTGLPFPSLPVFVQSLLDSKNLVDLEDLIDAMNWGGGCASAHGIQLSDQPYPAGDPPKLEWEISTRTRQSRMG